MLKVGSRKTVWSKLNALLPYEVVVLAPYQINFWIPWVLKWLSSNFQPSHVIRGWEIENLIKNIKLVHWSVTSKNGVFQSDHNSTNNRRFSIFFAFLIVQWHLQVCQISLKCKTLGVTHLLIWHGMTCKSKNPKPKICFHCRLEDLPSLLRAEQLPSNVDWFKSVI